MNRHDPSYASIDFLYAMNRHCPLLASKVFLHLFEMNCSSKSESGPLLASIVLLHVFEMNRSSNSGSGRHAHEMGENDRSRSEKILHDSVSRR